MSQCRRCMHDMQASTLRLTGPSIITSPCIILCSRVRLHGPCANPVCCAEESGHGWFSVTKPVFAAFGLAGAVCFRCYTYVKRNGCLPDG